MKRAPQDLIQNKTAVFWLQNPFCSTSACQLAPLGKGGNPGISLGNRGRKHWRIQEAEISSGREAEIRIFWFLEDTEWAECCWRARSSLGLHSSGSLKNLLQEKGIPIPEKSHQSFWLIHELCGSRREISSEMLVHPILVPKIRNPCSSIWGRGKKYFFFWDKKPQRTIWIRERPTHHQGGANSNKNSM